MKASPTSLRDRYESVYVPKIDNMRLDSVLRFKRVDAPGASWFYRRAELNLFTCCVHNIGDEVVIVRIA